jgi:4-hydroxy-3-polyprenylbenzoate decarboxylase
MPYPYKAFHEWFEEEEKLGNVLRIKTPLKCGDYGNIVDIGNGIPGKQPETEMRAVSRYLHSLQGKPIGIIENPVSNRPDIPVVVNPWPTRERVLRGMGLGSKDELCKKITDIPTNRIKPVKVDRGDAPCKQVVISGEKIDLRKDIPRVWVEFHQCLWSGFNGTVIICDTDTGSHSLGKLRVGQYEWKEANPDDPFPEERVKNYMFAAIARGSPRPTNTGRYYLKHRAENRPMPAALTFGDPTDVHVLAALKTLPWPQSGDEYEALGGFRGEPVEVVESETIPGLFVPAHSQWVIEGEFIPEDEKLPSYAGDDNFIPYILGGMVYAVFRVKCITHRNQPWWTASLSSSGGLNGHEGTHTALAALNLEAEAINHLRSLGFKVKDVALPVGPMMAVIQLEVDAAGKPYPYYGKKVGMALSAYGVHISSSYIIVVGPDIDPHDAKDVMWALGMLTMPISDSIAVKEGLPGLARMLGTPVAGQQPDTSGEQVIIDATIPVPERYAGWRPRSDPPEWEREAIRIMRKKLAEKKMPRR